MAETGANREYRDRLFKFIFGNPQNKEWTLSLYHAVNGSLCRCKCDQAEYHRERCLYEHEK